MSATAQPRTVDKNVAQEILEWWDAHPLFIRINRLTVWEDSKDDLNSEDVMALLQHLQSLHFQGSLDWDRKEWLKQLPKLVSNWKKAYQRGCEPSIDETFPDQFLASIVLYLLRKNTCFYSLVRLIDESDESEAAEAWGATACAMLPAFKQHIGITW